MEVGWEYQEFQDVIHGEHMVMILFPKLLLKNTNLLKGINIKKALLINKAFDIIIVFVSEYSQHTVQRSINLVEYLCLQMLFYLLLYFPSCYILHLNLS